MPTKNEYSPLRYGLFIVLCTVVGGVALGLAGRASGLNLFEDFGGIPGFGGLGAIFFAVHEAEARCKPWLKKASSSSSATTTSND